MPYATMRTGEEELVSWGRCDYVYDAFLAILAVDEFDYSAYLGKESIVFTLANVHARKKPAASLTHQDGSAGYHLAVKRFYTQSL